jgi:hypothetical protein
MGQLFFFGMFTLTQRPVLIDCRMPSTTRMSASLSVPEGSGSRVTPGKAQYGSSSRLFMGHPRARGNAPGA